MSAQYFSPPEQRVQLQHEAPPKVIGTDCFRVDLQGPQALKTYFGIYNQRYAKWTKCVTCGLTGTVGTIQLFTLDQDEFKSCDTQIWFAEDLS